MQSNMAQMATYGIIIGIAQLMLTLLANIEMATKSDYGRKFCSAMHAIRKKYTYNHVHNVALLQIILKELVGADGVRVLKDAPTLGTGTTHLVAKLISCLQAIMDGDTNSVYTKLVYGVNFNSNLSKEEHKPRGRDPKKSQCSKLHGEHGKEKKDKDDEPKKNTCPSARNSIARSLIKLNRTGPCGTRNTKANASNQSVTMLKGCSNHPTNSLQS